MPFLYALLLIVPKNLVSFLTGVLVRIEFPPKLQFWFNTQFVRLFKINMGEAAEPLPSFKSIEDVFIRKLQVGARPLAPVSLVSPSDGFLAYSQAITGGEALQAKGIRYRADELVLGKEHEGFDAAWYTTVYLAPKNYHRVHCPVRGRLQSINYFPGQLWPVNEPFVNLVPHLFVKNERVVFHLLTPQNNSVYVVMVGALNVGRMALTHVPGFFTNPNGFIGRSGPIPVAFDNVPELQMGDELGVFMLGSTVVLVYDKAALNELNPRTITGKTEIKLGHALT